MEAFDLAAGLGVVGPGVDVVDAEFAEQDLQGGASAASGCGGEDGAVVGEQGCGGAPGGEGGGEGVDDVGSGDGAVGGGGDGQARMVVDDVEDFELV